MFMLSDIIQKEKDKYWIISLINGIETHKPISSEKKLRLTIDQDYQRK